MQQLRSIVVGIAVAGVLAGCAPAVDMSLVTVTETKAPQRSDMAEMAVDPAPPQVDSVRFVVRGKGQLDDGQALRPGSKVKVAGIPTGSRLLLTTRDDTGGKPVTTSKDTWMSDSLPPSTAYRLIVQAPDSSQAVVGFRTRGTDERVAATISPSEGTFGVGMPIVIEFPAAVKSRKAVEAALTIDASRDIGEASWFWPDSDTVMFRPKKFWPARTKVTVRADLADVQIERGTWGTNESATFKIGAEVIMEQSLTQYKLVYRRDGRKVETFPISGGKPGWETLNGVKIVHEAYEMKRMINNAPGAGYDVMVPYAMRLTYSGEFMHAAPWNGNIGSANTSHGCTNMVYDDAVWMYNHTRFGDVFITKGGAAGSVTFGDGLGGVWDVPWKEWKAGSAI